MELILKKLHESIDVKAEILNDKELIGSVQKSADLIIEALKRGNKVLFCGNGGSAADAQHLTAEFLGRFYFDRAPLPAISLTTNTSIMTALANDYDYDEIFLRQLKGLGVKGDVLVGLSTSGNSKNVMKAMEYAREAGIINIAFTGKSGGKMKELADILINVPSQDTPRIQEAHITLGHIICEIIESTIFGSSDPKSFATSISNVVNNLPH